MHATVASVVETLSPEEKSRAVIAAHNYGQAAALEFFGRDSNLPPVISGHNQYFLWGVGENSAEILIDVQGDCGKDLHLYQSATLAATFTHPYVMPNENNVPIMVCRGLNRPLKEIWPTTKLYW